MLRRSSSHASISGLGSIHGQTRPLSCCCAAVCVCVATAGRQCQTVPQQAVSGKRMIGLDWTGLDWTGLDWTGQDWDI